MRGGASGSLRPEGKCVLRIERPNTATTVALLASIGACVATYTGAIKDLKDAGMIGGQSSAQIDTIDQRLKTVEDVMPTVEAIKKSASDLAETVRRQLSDAQRAGEDVRDLKARQRELELQVARLDTLIETMRSAK